MKKETRLYNVVFPVWLLVLFPAAWLAVIPANFAMDSLVLLIAAGCLRLDRKTVWKRAVLWVVLFGFLADLAGALLLFATQLFYAVPGAAGQWLSDTIGNAVAFNPFRNPFAFGYVLLCTAVSGLLIYLLDFHVAFRRLDAAPRQKRRLSLALAIATAPYLFFWPSELLYTAF